MRTPEVIIELDRESLAGRSAGGTSGHIRQVFGGGTDHSSGALLPPFPLKSIVECGFVLTGAVNSK
jgi:hypothetical protein